MFVSGNTAMEGLLDTGTAVRLVAGATTPVGALVVAPTALK
jgi:hypothetical protein